jgi:hypothetical protein
MQLDLPRLYKIVSDPGSVVTAITLCRNAIDSA